MGRNGKMAITRYPFLVTLNMASISVNYNQLAQNNWAWTIGYIQKNGGK